jgi:hypothetical protein
MAHSWCNFCEENHEESTCEVKKNVRDKIFGKRPDTTIIVLDWVEPEYVMVVNTRNKSYTAKGKYDLPHTSSTPSSSSQSVDTQVVKILDNPGVSSPLPYSKYDATLLDMVVVPEQQKHLKNFMEGKISTITKLFEESKEEESTVNKRGINNFKNPVKKNLSISL